MKLAYPGLTVPRGVRAFPGLKDSEVCLVLPEWSGRLAIPDLSDPMDRGA